MRTFFFARFNTFISKIIIDGFVDLSQDALTKVNDLNKVIMYLTFVLTLLQFKDF